MQKVHNNIISRYRTVSRWTAAVVIVVVLRLKPTQRSPKDSAWILYLEDIIAPATACNIKEAHIVILKPVAMASLNV